MNTAISGKALKILPGNAVHLSNEIVEQPDTSPITKINELTTGSSNIPQLTIPGGAGETITALYEGSRRFLASGAQRTSTSG